MKERVDVSTGGWIAYRTQMVEAKVRYEDRDGRLVPVELKVKAKDGLGTETVRSLPLGRLDSLANGEGERFLRQWLDRDPDEESKLLNPRGPAIPEAKLDVPPAGGDYGDAFYRQVARYYRSLAARVRAPAMALAEANEVPVTTARRWIKEARARGFLPAGRAGKAG